MSLDGADDTVAGWATERVRPRAGQVTTAEALVQMLAALGVRHVFGIVGGAIAPFADAVARSELALWHTRHEAGAAFCATEACFATNNPTALFVTTGPGLTNAITGLMAARWDGARVVLVSGTTSTLQRGRWAVQETSPHTTPSELHATGRLFDYAVTLSSVHELSVIARRLAFGFARPEGFVAHVAIPLDLQSVQVPAPRRVHDVVATPGPSPTVIDACLERLRADPTPIWIGHGARHATTEILELAERTRAPMMCSPRAKGTVPENHPQYLGVTGVGGHAEVERYVQRHRPAHVLVLGSRLGEVTSCWSSALVPRKGFIHVDLDSDVFGTAYPEVDTLAVQAEVQVFLRAILARLGTIETRATSSTRREAAPIVAPRPTGRVRPQALMQAVQQVFVDGSDAVVMTESGNAFGWGNHLLRFEQPHRYRTSAAFGSMGHFVTGVVGAALAREGKAVAIVGDGAMLMNNEISTAVRYDARAVWIVLDDGRYGITHHAMAAQGFTPVETTLPPTDFVAFARSMGADGVRVDGEAELVAALARARDHAGPFVVDVMIDPSEVSPVLARRVASLIEQGAIKAEERSP